MLSGRPLPVFCELRRRLAPAVGGLLRGDAHFKSGLPDLLALVPPPRANIRGMAAPALVKGSRLATAENTFLKSRQRSLVADCLLEVVDLDAVPGAGSALDFDGIPVPAFHICAGCPAWD